MIRSMSHFALCCLTLVLLVGQQIGSTAVATPLLSKQRQHYMQARQALAARDRQKFESLASGLQDYPLYPYLRYEELMRDIDKASEARVRQFLDNY